jgi:hypothetical protein
MNNDMIGTVSIRFDSFLRINKYVYSSIVSANIKVYRWLCSIVSGGFVLFVCLFKFLVWLSSITVIVVIVVQVSYVRGKQKKVIFYFCSCIFVC